MTVVSTVSENSYTGSGITGPYAYTYRIDQASDLAVIVADTNGAQTTLAYPGDYTVTGVGQRAGGTITLTTALASGWAMVVKRNLAIVQTRSIRNQGPTFPATIEDAIDYLTGVCQDLAGRVSRAFTVPETIPPSVASAEILNFTPLSYLRVNAAGTAVEGVADVTSSVGTLSSLTVTGTVTAGAVVGPLTGDVTGNVSGTAATVTGAVQSAITTLGTLVSLAVTGVTALTGRLSIGAALTSAFGDAIRARTDSSSSGTVECVRVEMHNSAGVTGTKYAIDAAVYADHATGTLQAVKGINAAMSQTGAGTTTTAHALEANFAVTAGTVTNATLATLLSPSVSVGTITNLTGLSIGNMAVGTTTNFAITTGTGLVQFGDELILAASTTTRSGLRLTLGVAPTSPVDGDMWQDGTNLKIRIGGVTKTVTLT